MGKKGIKKRLIAMLLVSVLLLSGIAVRYVTEKADSTGDSIAVSGDFTGEVLAGESGPVELVKNTADMAPAQLPSHTADFAEDGGTDPGRNNSSGESRGAVNDDNGVDSKKEVSEEFATASSFAPGTVKEQGGTLQESVGEEGGSPDTGSDSSISIVETETGDSAAEKTEEEINHRLVNDSEQRMSEIIAENMPKQDDVVDFIVVLDKAPLLTAFSSEEVKANTSAVSAYRDEQMQLIGELESALEASFGQEDGFSLGYDYTMSTTGISVKTRYINKEAIEQMTGVEKVYVSPSFEMSASVETASEDQGIYTNNSSAMIGATQVNATGFTGKGMKIAIIDTGIVLDHPSFQPLSQDKLTRDSMTEEFVDEIWDSLNAGRSTSLRNQAYYNSKLPFVFNYNGVNFDVSHETASHDHGTHVAGIAAANKISTSNVVGIAPDAQLIVMQVFNRSGGAEWSTIMAALEDCVRLDVDTVNLSLGSAAGFTDGDAEMVAVLNQFEETDIQVVIAGGNDTNNAYMNLTGKDMSKTKDIDNGLIGTPATASRALSVASADNDGADLPYFTVGEQKFGFSDSAVTAQTNFLDRFKGQSLDFVVIDGVGDAGDYADKDVQDKVAVVSRGTISFQEKQRIAKEKGAVALVVFNNIPGSFSMAISDGDGHIPCVAISKSDGETLKSKSAGSLTVCNEGELTHVSVDRAMSSFSSWGVTPDLKLKPEISGVGGNIYSTRDPYIGGSNYGSMSGTSMASPQVAGAVTVLTQYLKETYNNRYADKELRKVATNLLMSTASQIREGETVYSPRYQGAGLVDLSKATSAGAYLSSPTAFETRPKGEMGDNASKNGVFTFPFTITNITNEQKTYTFDSTVLTPNVDEAGEYMTNTTKALETKVEVSQNNSTKTTILVPANSSVELNASITLTTNDKNFINNNFENGTYVEGYLYVKASGQNGVNLSMPFLGFFGDWSDAPVFDEKGEDASLYSPAVLTRKGKIGQNPYIPGGKSGNDYNAISDVNPITEMVFGMLRNSKKVAQTVTDKSTQAQYFTFEEEYITKSYYNSTYGMIIPYTLFNFNEQVFVWDGKNNGTALPDNTKVTYSIASYLDDGDDQADDTYSFDVTIDNTSPQVENAESLSTAVIKDTEKGTVKLPLTITDNHYVAAVIFESFDGSILGKFEVENQPNVALETEFDVTGYGTDFTVIVADYACNETEIEVSLDLSDMPSTQPEPIKLEKGRIYGNETYSDGYVSMGWFSADKTDFSNLKNETFDAAGKTYSGEYINGYVIAQRASDGALLLLTPYSTYWNTKVIMTQEGSVGNAGFKVLYDMALDYSTDTLYAVGWAYAGDNNGDSKDDGHNALFKVKLEDTVSLEEVARIEGLDEEVEALTLGCTTEGQLYTISNDGKLYRLSKENGETVFVGETDFVNEPNYSGVNVIQSMCYDHESDTMYWYAHSQTIHAGRYIHIGAIYTIDLTNAKCTKVGGTGSGGYTSLFIPTDETSDIFIPRVEPTGIEITPSAVKMAKGQSRRMSVQWEPWNALPGTVQWTSQDQNVATVNTNGVVRAVNTGETTITATTTIGDQTRTQTARVTVVNSSDALYGYVITDYNSKVADRSWVTYSDSNLKGVSRIGSGGLIQGGTYYNGHVYFVIAEGEGMVKTTVLYKSAVTPGETPGQTTIGAPEVVGRTEGIEVGNIGFDYSTGRMYGVDYTNGGLCLIDVDTGDIDLLGTFNGDLKAAIMPAMCVTANGKVIGSDMFGNLYHVNPDDMSAVKIGSIEPDSWFYAGMTYDHNSGNIYWNPCMDSGYSDLYLVQIDQQNPSAATTEIINLGGVGGSSGVEQTAMFTIPAQEPETIYIQADSIQITNGETLTGLTGGSLQLTTRTEPVRPSTYAREWESSNTEVVQIDRFGRMSFVGEGTATVKVTVRNKGNNPKPACTDTVTVNVYPAAGQFAAFLTSDESASSYYDFWIDIKDYDPQHSVVGASMIGTYSLRTGEYYDGYFYAYNDVGDLYRINKDNYADYVTLGNHGLGEDDQVISMAFDYASGTMYGITLHKGGNPGKLVKVNLNNGSLTEVCTLSTPISAIAGDESGTIYGVGSQARYQVSNLYKVDKESGNCTVLQQFPEDGKVWTGDNYMGERMYSPQMTYDHGTKRLYLNATIREKMVASRNYGFFMIQLQGEGTEKTVDFIANLGKPALQLSGNLKIGDLYLGMLCSVPDDEEVVSEVVTGVRINREAARVEKGSTTQLSAAISPSGAADKTVIWSSEEEGIAAVDENGLVTGVSAGTTTITATSVSNSAVSASCTVTVIDPEAVSAVSTAYTISAKQEALISFNPELPVSTAKRIVELSGGRRIVGMDIKDDRYIYYLVSEGEGPWPELYRFDLSTKSSVSMGWLHVFIGGASDMAYDPVNELLYVVSGFYIFQFEEDRLRAGDVNGYSGYLDTSRLEIPLSHMHAVTCKEGLIYFLGSDNSSTLYSVTDRFRDLRTVRSVGVNTVSGKCEMAYDANTSRFYLTDAGDRLYSFTEEGEDVTLIDILGNGWDMNGLAINPEGAPDMPALPVIPDRSDEPTAPTAPEIPASDIITEEVVRGGAIDLTDNIKNLPEGAVVEVVENVSSENAGSFTGRVRVRFENGTSREVAIPVIVKEAGTTDPNPPAEQKPWPFTDVEEIKNHWKYENIKYVYDNDIMNGISGTSLFQPDQPLTRAMFATVIYRMAGEPEVAFEDKFSDVKDGKYYSRAIIWASQQGIVQGFGDGTYGVNKNITREQIAKMLYQYADTRGYDVSGAAPLDTFTDAEKVNSWAVSYMKWAVDTGMITGKPNGDGSFRLEPKGEATRAECAKMLTMFMKEYQK